MTRQKGAATLLWFLAAWTSAPAEEFPLPAELEPDVQFWVDVFSRYSTDQGVLHDSRRLDVVYEVIDFDPAHDRRERRRITSARRDRLKDILDKLAGGSRTDLAPEEAAVLALWPADVDSDELAAAKGRIRYQQGLADRFREGLARSGRWRTYIEAEMTALGVPADLVALPHVESSFNPDARSHVGASGIWQFTRSTGRRFMRIDHVIDERNDPFAATRAAAQLLAYNYSITGNWPMAITAYNHGLAGVRRAMSRHGDTAYVEIMRKYNGRTFGFASRNFYVAFLAARRIDQDPEAYFPGVAFEAPVDFDEIELDAYVAARDLSRALGVSERDLARHNPALQATVWQGSKHVPRGYRLRLPRAATNGSLADMVAGLDAGQRHGEQLPDLFHTVVRGDTLSEIAEAYDTRVSTLVALNQLGSSHRIRAGQRLRLPAAGPVLVAAGQPPVVAAVVEPEPEPEPELEPEPEIVAEAEVVEEVMPATMTGDIAATLLGTLQTALLSDPSDYSVADDGTIEVHELETLGHFADWLEIRTQRLRDINGLPFGRPVAVGKRLQLDLGRVDAATFESRRVAYHRRQQDSFFRKHVITGITEHVVERGESIWILSLREYDVPIWLFRQYNPGLDLDRIRPGMTVRFPVMAAAPQT